MPKERTEGFDVDQFLKSNVSTKKVEEEENEIVAVGTEETQEEIDFSQPKNRVAAALINQEPSDDGFDWQTEQDVDLGDYKANRIKTERREEVERIKKLRVENTEQIGKMMDELHGNEPAEVVRDPNEKILSKESLMAAQEKQRLEEADKTDIVDVMMRELLTNYRPKDK